MLNLLYNLVSFLFGSITAMKFYLIAIAVILVILTVRHIKRATKKDDWLSKAQETQNKRYEYTDPVKPKRSPVKEPKRLQPKNGEPKWYPTGWVFNEFTGKWDPPEYLTDDSRSELVWNDKEIQRNWQEYYDTQEKIRAATTPERLTWEERQLAGKIYIERKEPTFEEWKAMREQEQQKEQHPEE